MKMLKKTIFRTILRCFLFLLAFLLMTFNLRYSSASDGSNKWENADQHPQRREVVVRVITNYMPDLMGFQEGEDDQLAYLAAYLPDCYAIEQQKPSGGGGSENAAFAYNTNLLALLDRGTFSLGTSPGGGYWNNTPGTNFNPYLYFPDMGLAFPRLAIWGLFQWQATGQEFVFYSTHYDFNDEPQVRSAWLMTDDALARNDRMPDSPLAIIAGDFNSTQNDRDWHFFTGTLSTNGLTGDFTDSWYQVEGSWTDSGTIHGFHGGTISENSRIDWMLHRGGFIASNIVIVSDHYLSTNTVSWGTHILYPSDHYPVMATLHFPASPPDFDRDRLPDDMEFNSTNSLPADPDTDNDMLLDGQEDLNGNGVVDGGETDPSIATTTHKPTDIRQYQMDGILDYRAELLASNGLDLHGHFDGRYLYVTIQDSGEGSDHFVFVTTNPDHAVSAPWGKGGQVAGWIAYLADENDNDFCGWFDATGTQITNVFFARAVTYFENGGQLEGVLDLAQILGAGFTNVFYLAAAPYETGSGGTNYAAAQVPAGNGDGDILGTNEYLCIHPGDRDQDGINDYADPDCDGDQLPDAWEEKYNLNPASDHGMDGADGDPDGDRADNQHEFFACTSPTNPASLFKIIATEWNGSNLAVSWPAVDGKVYQAWQSGSDSFSNGMTWSCFYTSDICTHFPLITNTIAASPGHAFLRLQVVK